MQFQKLIYIFFFILTISHSNNYITDEPFEFSGYKWVIKDNSQTKIGPGYNYFLKENVYYDEDDGSLHLKITYDEITARWTCAEVLLYLKNDKKKLVNLGYGEYIFKVASNYDKFDDNAVVGFFKYKLNGDDTFPKEIDMEFTRWGKVNNTNSQYAIQSWKTHKETIDKKTFQTNFTSNGTYTTHRLIWTPRYIAFRSNQGHTQYGDEINSWVYMGKDLPPDDNLSTIINFWLYDKDNNKTQNNYPENNTSMELIIKSFEFIKYNPLQEITN